MLSFVFNIFLSFFHALVMVFRWPKVGMMLFCGELLHLGGLAGVVWSFIRLNTLSMNHWAGFVGAARVQVIVAGVVSLVVLFNGGGLFGSGEKMIDEAEKQAERREFIEEIRTAIAGTDLDGLDRRR